MHCRPHRNLHPILTRPTHPSHKLKTNYSGGRIQAINPKPNIPSPPACTILWVGSSHLGIGRVQFSQNDPIPPDDSPAISLVPILTDRPGLLSCPQSAYTQRSHSDRVTYTVVTRNNAPSSSIEAALANPHSPVGIQATTLGPNKPLHRRPSPGSPNLLERLAT